jgi:NAD+ kinase
MKTIGVVVHDGKDTAIDAAKALMRQCEAVDVEARLVASPGDVGDVEALIGVGGDGTVLRAASLALDGDVPLAGINVGRVGYLAEFAVDEIGSLASGIADDGLLVVERMTAAVRHGEEAALAVNDVVVEKVVTQRMVEIAVAIDGHPFAGYRTDGIIVATPVGSTAYSLSSGGPVLDPTLEAFVITPVAPHSLLSRSIVVSAESKIRLDVIGDRPARINVDGRELSEVPPGDTVVVTAGDRPVRFLTLGGHPFPQAVRHQFGLEHA